MAMPATFRLSTTLSVSSASGTYGGTASLSATLSNGCTPIAGRTIAFTVNGTSVGSATTDVSGTATVASASLSGVSVGAYGTGARASFAGDSSYTSSSGSSTLTVNARALTVTATGINKVYDGGTSATVILSDNRVSGDVFTDSYTGASFAGKAAGSGKTISVSGISISGAAAANYTVNTTATATANITQRALTVSAMGVNKGFDGTTAATVTLSDNRVSGDVFTDSYTSASFSDASTGVGKTVTVTGISISGADAANYTANSSASTTANITGKTLTVTATGVNKVYDGGTSATVTLADNRTIGDNITVSYASATFAAKSVGNGVAVSVSGISVTGPDAASYISLNTTATTAANITAKTLTVSASGINKVFDGGTTATVTLSDNRVSGDVFTDSYTAASFSDSSVGVGKIVSVSGISITGTDAANYSANSTTTTTASITGKTLTVTASGVNKVYDGGTSATVTLSDNRTTGDNITVSYTTAAFAAKNAGNSVAVSVSGISVTGPDAASYTSFNTTASATANITAKALAVSATGVNKIYDGAATATVTLSDNRVAGDVFTASYSSASFSDKNVAAGKTISVSGISISGTDAANYTPNTTAGATANITAKPLMISATGVNKVYDGGASATVTLSDNRISGDVFSSSYSSASFADKTVAAGKTVSVSGIAISGADAANYTPNTTASATANITGKPLAISATGINKVYDGGTSATVTLSDNRVSGDVFSSSYSSASFADKTVAVGKAVSVSGISISGADAANYTFNTTAGATANVTVLALTVSATGINKVFDGGTSATVTLSDNRVSGDVFTDSYASASFSDRIVGVGKTVSVSGISISGADAANYTFNTTATTVASITGKPLTITATGVNKVYDGNTSATVVLSDNRVSGDVFTDSYTTASFVDKNAGSGKTVSVSGISISGADAANYTFNTTATATANVTARPLTITATGVDKVYNRTTQATVTFSDNRLEGDVFTDHGNGFFGDANVGSAKPVTVANITIAGADAGNYSYNTTARTTANITPATPALSVTGFTGTYDGASHGASCVAHGVPGPTDRPSPIAERALRPLNNNGGPVNGTCTFTYTPGGATIPVGAGAYAVSVLFTSSDSNYTSAGGSTTITISQASLTVTASAQTITYGVAPTYTATYSGFVGEDSPASVSGTAAFSTNATLTNGKPNAGTWTITPAVGSLSAANYSIATFVPGTLTVGKAALTVTANSAGKAYGAPLPALSAMVSGYVNGDTSSVVSGTPVVATIATANSPAGNYAITVSGSLSAANYTFTYAPGTLTISAGVLTVITDGGTRIYGAQNSLSYSISGFVNGDTAAVVSGAPVLSTTASQNSSPGTYAVTATIGTLATPSYTFAFQFGSLVVTPATTDLGLSAPTTTVGAGQSFTLNFLLAPVSGGAAPSGAVIYSVDGGASQSVSLANGAATVTLSPLAVGAHHLVSNYSGDVNYAATTPHSVTLTVTALSTQLTVSATPGMTAPQGQPITLTFSLTGTPAPSGTVAYSLDGGAPQMASVSSGTAVASLSGLAMGQHVLSYSYSGDRNYPSISRTATIVVTTPLPVLNTVVNAADFGSKISAGGLATIFGAGLATDTLSATAVPLPITLHGTQVLVNGATAPITFVSTEQINFQVPIGTLVGTPVQVAVVLNGVSSLPTMVTFFTNAPAVFDYYRTPDSFEPIVVHADNSLVTPSAPATAGEILTIYATGAGALNNPPLDGQPAPSSPASTTKTLPIVMVGGVAATVQFSGLTPESVGLLQINIQLPATLPAGSGTPPTLPLGINLGGSSSTPVKLWMVQ